MTPTLRAAIVARARARRAYQKRYDEIWPGHIFTDKTLDALWMAQLDRLCDLSAVMREEIPDEETRAALSWRISKATDPKFNATFWSNLIP